MQPLMPIATALWLIENTSLTFEQISNFCQISILEIKALADGSVGQSVLPKSPINTQLSQEEIDLCQKDSKRQLTFIKSPLGNIEQMRNKKKKRYVSLAKRHNKPDAIYWLLKQHPELSAPQIIKLVGTTKRTVEGIKARTFRGMDTISAKDPVIVGLCSQLELDTAIAKAQKKLSEAKATTEK